MATMNINVSSTIHAEILLESEFVLSNTPLIIDPLTNSYSDYSKLKLYKLTIINTSDTIINPQLLENGKNSRFTADGYGEVTIELYIEDEEGYTDTDTITFNVN